MDAKTPGPLAEAYIYKEPLVEPVRETFLCWLQHQTLWLKTNVLASLKPRSFDCLALQATSFTTSQ